MIIGLTGSLSSGKGIVSNYLKEKNFTYYSLSNEVREQATKRGIEITRHNLQNLGNKLREENHNGIFAEFIINKIKNTKDKNIIIDGIRNPGEIEFFRKNLDTFILIAMDASKKLRFKRLVERSRESDPNTWEEFLKVDNRDQGINEKESGQGVKKCMDSADYTLINEGSLEEINEKIKDILNKIER